MNRMRRFLTSLTVVATLLSALSASVWAVPLPSDGFNFGMTFAPETQLVVYVDGEWNTELSGVYGYGETVQLTVPEELAIPESAAKKSFSHWEADGSVISYSKNLTLTLNAHTTLYAVYASSAPTPKDAASFTSVTRSTDGNSIVFQAVAAPSEGAVEAAGILYSTTVSGSALTLDNESASKEAAVKSVQGLTDIPKSFLDENNCWSFQLTPTDENATCYARAYATIGGTPVYGDVKTIKLSELSDGVAMIANLEGFDLYNLGEDGWKDIRTILEEQTSDMRTVTFYANGGVGAPITQAYLGESVTLRANSFTRDGYVFSGWSTEEKGGGTTYTDGQQNVALGETKQLYAQWRVRSSGGSSSGTATTVTVPVTGDSGTVSVSVSVKDKDATVAPLTEKQVDSIVGTGSTASTVEIDASSLGKEITTVTIPADTVKVIEAAVSSPDKDAESLTVKLSEGSITFDAEALKTIAEQTKGDGLKVNLDDIGTEKLNTAQKTAVSDLTVETVLDAYVTSGSTRISDFKGGSATVNVKHTLKADQRPAGIVVWYVADNGTRTQIPATFRNGEIVFTVTHFSNYVIAYDAERAANSHLNCQKDATCPITAFTDASATAWYHDGVHFALENNIMSGYGNGKFGPGDTTSRAMMAQILWNMEGKPVVNYAMSYTDVDTDAWYAEAVRWATAQGIMSGYGYNKFGPNDDMTREQLVTIMYRYAQMKKVDVSIGEDTNILSYDDAFDVSEWAVPAMQWAVGAGIVNGTSASTLSPKNNASRAEIATIVMRYCVKNAK